MMLSALVRLRLLILYFVALKYGFLKALVITNGPRNVTVCSGNRIGMPCGFTGASVFNTARPDWRIIKRNNDGYVISNETVSGQGIHDNRSDGLAFFRIRESEFSANGSVLSVGPVDDTYNNTSYQCIFTINDTIIESDTAGTITVIGAPSSPVLTYESTLNEILVSWSPVGSDTVCGSVTYNITVIPSHGMIMMINDTLYNITRLHDNTNYTITVYATNDVGDGEPATITIETKPLLVTEAITVMTLPPSMSPSESNGTNMGTTVGAVIGGIVGIIIITILLLVMLWYYRKQHEKTITLGNSPVTMSDAPTYDIVQNIVSDVVTIESIPAYEVGTEVKMDNPAHQVQGGQDSVFNHDTRKLKATSDQVEKGPDPAYQELSKCLQISTSDAPNNKKSNSSFQEVMLKQIHDQMDVDPAYQGISSHSVRGVQDAVSAREYMNLDPAIKH